ncbi:MAG: hypothetical protein ACRC62_34645 [Microcoleus sp.]
MTLKPIEKSPQGHGNAVSLPMIDRPSTPYYQLSTIDDRLSTINCHEFLIT